MTESEEKIKLNIAQLKTYFRVCVNACDEILTNEEFDSYTVKRIMDLCLQRIDNAKIFITKNCLPSNIGANGDENGSSHLLLSQVKEEPKTIENPKSVNEYRDKVISSVQNRLSSLVQQSPCNGQESPDLFMSDSSVTSNCNGPLQINGVEGKSDRNDINGVKKGNGEITVQHHMGDAESLANPANSNRRDSPSPSPASSKNVKSKLDKSQRIKSKAIIDDNDSSGTSLTSEDEILSLIKSKTVSEKNSRVPSVDSQVTALPSSYDDNEETNDMDSNVTVINSIPEECGKVKVMLNRIPLSSLNSLKTNSTCEDDTGISGIPTSHDMEYGEPDTSDDSSDVRNNKVALWRNSLSGVEDSHHVRNKALDNKHKASPLGKTTANSNYSSSSSSSDDDELPINVSLSLRKKSSVLRLKSSSSSSSSSEEKKSISSSSSLTKSSSSSSTSSSEYSSSSKSCASDIESCSSSSSFSVARSSKNKKRKSTKLTKKNVIYNAPLAKRKFFEDSDSSKDDESSESDVSADDEEVSAALKHDMMKRERLMKQRAETKELLNPFKESDDEQCVTFRTSMLKLTRLDDLIELTDDESIVLWPTIPKTVWHQLGHTTISRDVKFQELKDYALSDSSNDSVARLTQMVKLNERLVPRKRKKKGAWTNLKKRRKMVRSDSDEISEDEMSPVGSDVRSNQSWSDVSQMSVKESETVSGSEDSEDGENEAIKRLLMEDSEDEAQRQDGINSSKTKKLKAKTETEDCKKSKDKVVLAVPKMPSLETNKRRRKRRAAKVGEVKRRTGKITTIHLPSSGDSSDFESLNSSNYSSSVEEISSDDDFQNTSTKHCKKQKLTIDSESKSESKSGSLSEVDKDTLQPIKEPSQPTKDLSQPKEGLSQPKEGLSQSKEGSGSVSDDSDINITRVERLPSSQRRKNIRGIIRQQDLSFDTLHADMEQRNRKKRYKDLQSKYNQYLVLDKKEEGKLEKVILQEDPLVQVEPSLACCLREHQAKAMQMLWFNLVESVDRVKNGDPGSGAMVAHYMGLGKTLTTIALIHTILMHTELLNIRSFLIIVPKNVLENWCKEWKKWMNISEQRCPRIFTVHHDSPRDRPRIVDRWHQRGGILIVSYTIMTNAFTAVYPELQKKPTKKKMEDDYIETMKRCLMDPGPDLVVCDEAHVMKNDNTILFQGMSMIKTKRRAILTGTPMQNHLIEYHTMVSFIKPNYLGTQREFKNRFANPISNGQKADSSKIDVKVMKKRTYILNRKLDSIMDRKDDSYLLNDIPPKLQYVINVRLSDVQAELYRTYLRHIGMESIDELSADEMNNLMLEENMHRKILQHRYIFQYICCHPTLLKWQQKIHASKNQLTTEVASQQTEQEKQACEQALSELAKADWWHHLYEEERGMDPSVSNKLFLLFLIIDACSDIGDKVVVFSNSVLALELIERMLKRSHQWPFKRRCTEYPERWEKGRDFQVLTGKTPSQDRQDMADRFNNEHNHRLRLFLISIKAGGVGMNLYGANRVVILDPSWNPADENQACGRAYRLGQKKRTYIYRLVGAGTAEEQLYKRQVDKQTLSLRVVDEQQTDRHYTQRELSAFYIFTHTEVPTEPDWAPPQDRLLADVMVAASHCITGYHLHENMLLNRNEEKLTEEEYAEAWKEYEDETKRQQNIDKPLDELCGNFTFGGNVDFLSEPSRSSAAMNFLKKNIPRFDKEIRRHLSERIQANKSTLAENLQDIGHTGINVPNPILTGVGSIGAKFGTPFGSLGSSSVTPGSGLGLHTPGYDPMRMGSSIYPTTSHNPTMPFDSNLPSSSRLSDNQNGTNSSLFPGLSDIGHVDTSSANSSVFPGLSDIGHENPSSANSSHISVTEGNHWSLSDIQLREQYPERFKQFMGNVRVVHHRLTDEQQKVVATRLLRGFLRTSNV